MLLRGEPICEHLDIAGSADMEAGWSATLLGQETDTRLSLSGGSLLCTVSVPDCERLAAPGCEGIYFHIYDGVSRAVTESTSATNGTEDQNLALRWFIEKDFPCVHPRASKAAEPVTEAFAPPADFEARKLPAS